ncbi:MAG: hypothetical protein HY056_12885 [Proteobacteria bacterium]|nr:hypothetical protein [Pseudomonadota bacterium]
MQPSETTEFGRFLVLFDRLVHETNDWIERTPKDRLDWIPIDNGNVRFGDRVSEVTIRSLYIHTVVAEHKFVRDLHACADGALISLPRDPELTARLRGADLVGEGMRTHDETMRRLRGFTVTQLGKTIRFAADDTTWTIMGFLWGMYGHRAYHLGNLDIYVRQADIPAPDFYSFQPKMMA